MSYSLIQFEQVTFAGELFLVMQSNHLSDAFQKKKKKKIGNILTTHSDDKLVKLTDA